MPRYQVDTTVIDIPASGAPRTWQTEGGGSPPATTYRVIVAVGESNAGGEAPVSSLPSNLQAATSRVQILINPGDTTFPAQAGTFQPLDLGTNNNLQHNGQTPATHGFEAGLIEYLDANPQTEPVYYVQCGQGGSTLGQWSAGSPFRLAMHSRIQAAKTALAALGRTSLAWQIWYSHGINDAIGPGLGPTDLRLAMAELLADVRAEIGVGTAAQIRMSQWPEPRRVESPSYLTDIETTLPASVTNMQLVLTGSLPVQDQNHWTSLGYRQGGVLLAATA